MNYSKSILSLVTILALNSSVFADPNATYVPLTNKSYDNAWVMFGVNGFGDGTSSAQSNNGIFTAGFSTVTEADSTDDLASPSLAVIAAAVPGTIFNDTGTKNMATFQALKDTAGTAYYTVPVTMGIKTNDLTYSETEPVRTMYIAIQTSSIDTNTVSKIKLDYKANLEGRTLEIQLNNTGTVYTATISQVATFDSPAIARYTAPTTTTVPLTSSADTLAYDLSASPIIASSYDKTLHQGTARGNERFYTYDAVNSVWNIWDRAKVVAGSNTLLNFEKGKAYWGRMNINAPSAGDTNTTSDTVAGLYLGKTGLGIADATVYTGKLTSGSWNMVAFDPASHPDIRNATTGIFVATTAQANGDAMTLVDETGVNAVDVNFTTATDTNTTALLAQYINETVDAAKLLGKVPKTFSVKAFGTGTDTAAGSLIFVSDKKFTVKDAVGNWMTSAKTIANNDVVDTATGVITNILDVNATGVTSRYGEYALLIEPLVGAGTASQLDSTITGTGVGLSAKVQFGDISGDSKNGGASATPLGLAANNTATTVATAKSVLATDDMFDGTTGAGLIFDLDSNFDGINDMLLASSNKPFYVKDHTYTRVYAIDSTTANGTPTATYANVAYTIQSTVSATKTPANGDAAAAFVAAINASADTTGAATDTLTYAAVDGANLVVVTAGSSLMDLQDADSAVKDYFTQTTSSADISKGAIKQVIDVSKLARQDVILNKKTITFTTDAAATATVDINTTVAGVAINPTPTVISAATTTDTLRLAFLNSLVTNLNTALKAAGSAAFASHNYIDGYNNIAKAVITINGVQIGNTVYDNNTTSPAATVAEANTNPGTINVASADITADLKDNPIYTPDYVNYGPLYTLKDAGYEAKAILRASTNIAATPTTHWDAIDLTRASSDWLKNNEFNLFSVSNSAGYWAYVTSYTNPNAISVSNVILTPSFAYHFNPITNTTNNIINTSAFSVDIAGSTASTSNAKLVIGGSEVQLVNTGTTYTANINAYETGLATNSANTLAIKVADGLGERYDNLNLVTLDYVKPAAPTVAFNTTVNATFSDTSTDLASYYLWANFIPDNGASATGPISITAAASYNMCSSTAFASSTPYKLVALDGAGTFGNANISDATNFTFANAEKDATVLTHSFGDSASTAMRYDANCSATANTTKSGVEVRAQQVGTVKLSYQQISGSVNVTNDIPVTSYYDIPTATGTAVVQVDSLSIYATKTFYVQYNNALYQGTFPANRAAGDASFATPLNLSAVNSANTKLD